MTHKAAPEEKGIEELMAEVAVELGANDINIDNGDIPPWENRQSIEAKIETKTDTKTEANTMLSSLFPALSGDAEEENKEGNKGSLPPPAPERDQDDYDRNNWSRLLRQAGDMQRHTEIVEYLEVLYQTGLGLELRPVRVKDPSGQAVTIEKFIFTPGRNTGWTDERIKEVMQALYTYMMFLPAWKELSQGGSDYSHPVLQAMIAAIRAGGLLGVTEKGLRFDWSRVTGKWGEEVGRQKVAEARGMMDKVGVEIMGYVRGAERGLREIGFVVSLAEMSDCVE